MREVSQRAIEPEALFAQIEDLLSEGYAQALEGDAWGVWAEKRLHELITNDGSPFRGQELRSLTREHAQLQRDLIVLRRELGELRNERKSRASGAGALST